MSLSNSTAWEARTTGSDTANSGGFRWGAFIGAPSAPTVTPSASGGTVAANTYYVVTTYTDGLGETVISGQTAVTTSGGTASFTTTSPSASTGALTWSHYCGTTSGGPYFPQGTGLTIGSNRVVTTTPPTTGTQPRGVDYSIQDGAQISVADAVANGTTTVTSATAAFTGAHVGNVAKIGAAFYDIVSVTNATTIVVDRTITSGSSLALIIGGGFASPGQVMSQAVTSAANIMYLKGGGTFTIGTGTNNTAGNKFTATQVNICGYTTNRYPGNTDTPPVLDAGGASYTMCSFNGNGGRYENLSFTNSGANASVTAMTSGAQCTINRMKISGIKTPYGGSSGEAHLIDWYMTGCGRVNLTGGGDQMIRGVAVNGTGDSCDFNLTVGSTARECVSYNCAPSTAAFIVGNALIENCVAYGATGSNGYGISLTTAISQAIGCISYGNAKEGFGISSTGLTGAILTACAAGGNTGDANGTNFDGRLAAYQKINCVTLTGDPFTSAAGGDYSLNSVSGAGASCRQLGIPGTFLGISTTGYRSIGAAEPQAAGGGTPHLAGRGGGLAG